MNRAIESFKGNVHLRLRVYHFLELRAEHGKQKRCCRECRGKGILIVQKK